MHSIPNSMWNPNMTFRIHETHGRTPKYAKYMICRTAFCKNTYFAFFGDLPWVSRILDVIFGFPMEFATKCMYNTSMLNNF